MFSFFISKGVQEANQSLLWQTISIKSTFERPTQKKLTLPIVFPISLGLFSTSF
jgi:hypothetical protein